MDRDVEVLVGAANDVVALRARAAVRLGAGATGFGLVIDRDEGQLAREIVRERVLTASGGEERDQDAGDCEPAEGGGETPGIEKKARRNGAARARVAS